MFSYLILGIIQGIFEWLPISSEGIVALSSRFLITRFNSLDVALFLHLGTVFAVLVYFRKDWKDVFTFQNKRLVRFLMVSTLVSLLIGYPLYRQVRDMVIGNSLLLVMGFGLLLTAFFNKKKREFEIKSDKLALIGGLLQGLAVIPGLSRSGSTIFGLSLGESDPSQILKISYMMSVPVVLASSFYLAFKSPLLIYEGWPSLVSSFLTGIVSLKFLLNLSKRVDFFRFSLIFSLLCFLGAFLGFLF